MELAKRVKRIPPYLFTVINEMKEKVAQERGDVVDLGMGNPDLHSFSYCRSFEGSGDGSLFSSLSPSSKRR